MKGRGDSASAPALAPPECFRALGALLSREELRVIRGPERRRLLSVWEDLAARERALDDRLFLGIIGGTGVGKSTLINAIAAAPISSAGDRRPTTERVVVYRHRDSPLPDDLPRGDLAQPEATHQEEGMERMVFLDFPDFDSRAADHAAILGRFLPRLDVLLLVVDDEKYGDLSLFDILRALPQATRNLHFILNKVDRLAERYPSRWKAVAGEILSDLSEKLARHAGFRPPADRMVPISARAAFLSRSRGDSRTDGAPEGDFRAVLDLLESYRAEKLRRAAKEANLEARKEALLEEARRAARLEEMGARAAALREALGEREAELERILEGTPAGILGPRERRRLRADALRSARPRLSFPMRWALPLLEGREGGGATGAEELASRARARYSPYLESLRSAEREVRSEAQRTVGEVGSGPPGGGEFRELAEKLGPDLDARLTRALRFAKLRAYLVPAALVVAGLWFALHPVIADLARRLADGEAVDWLATLARGAAALVKALSPAAIVFAAAILLSVCALALLLDWRRIMGALEGAVGGFERGARVEARRQAAERLAPLRAALDAWDRDRAALEKLEN